MYHRERYGEPERRASIGLPIGVMLLSMLAIFAYLLIGGAFSGDGSRNVAVYLPQVTQE